MQTTRIGILSDTHISQADPIFARTIAHCFKDVSTILHAGDLTNAKILTVFEDKTVHAVHGNMCNHMTCLALPRKKLIQIGAFSIGLIHNTGQGYDFEDKLIDEFDGLADCIVYGHTHKPVCHKKGQTLFINPGSFMATSRYGAPGTFGILEIGENMHAAIYEVPSKV